MILLYRVLTQLIYPFLFLLVLFRIFLKKENPKRYKEKILASHFNVKRNYDKKLIWLHAASIGELKSIIPIIKKLHSANQDKEFLVTTTTLSSSIIAESEFKNHKNVYHRFFPYDVGFLIDKFLKQWSPSHIFLVDSEIWPNLILTAKKLKIPLAIINARITSKSYEKWKKFPKTAYKIFSCFDLCLASNKETETFLKKLNVKKVVYHGNIKFVYDIDEKKIFNNNEIFLKNRIFWIAASTHSGEEEMCLKTHIFLREKYKNILTIIAPRHIERSQEIKSLCKKYNLNSQILSNDEFIEPKKEIVILNSFGILHNYFKYAKSVFIGKSILEKLKAVGGQNPLEAVKLNCKIYHGIYVYNFDDIYKILEQNNISFKIKNHLELGNYLKKDLDPSHKKNDKISEMISNISDKTLIGTLKEINNFIIDEI